MTRQPSPARTAPAQEPSQRRPPAVAVAPESARLQRQPWRVWAVALLLTLLGGLLVLRLFDMQIRLWSFYAQPAAQASAINSVDDSTSRGLIVDRDGELMALDHFTYQLTATPRHIPQEQWKPVAALLEQVAGIPQAQTLEALAQNPDGLYAVLARDLDYAQGQALLRMKELLLEDTDDENDVLVQQLHIAPTPRRFYPQGRLASQVLGFLNGERRPLLGLERYYDPFLRSDGVGLPRGNWQPVDVLPETTRRFLPTGKGKALVLTLDRTVQWIIEDELRQGVEVYGAQGGTVIVMDPRTGAILGMANIPTFDPNNFLQEDASTFTNPAVSAQYEPGSIFKVITMAAAIDAGAVEPTTVFTDTGMITLGQRTFLNSSRVGAGQLTVADALALSDNVVTIQVAETLGAKEFYRAVFRFGFGEATEIDLSNEIPGQVKAPGDPDWSLSDLATNSFGQGVAVTPIQMVAAAAAIANGGQLMRPYLVEARLHDGYILRTQPTVVRRVLRPEAAATMTEMMVHTVEKGNRAARVNGYAVAGKSGTAEIATQGGYNSQETIASFLGFAPADDPQFVILVKLDRPNPDISPWASKTAAPIFSRIAYRLLDHLNVPPDDIRLATAQEPPNDQAD